ncbi:MAG: hypothetical protein KF729_00360 [Sandaracinaceae bacterium]|nr:hypothetical protein [Sandaracinaceae bacterium]
MSARARLVLAALACSIAPSIAPSTAAAQAVVRRVPPPGEPNLVDYRVFFRSRGEVFYNLDLDRGPTPSGEPLFPVPQADPRSQLLTHGDMRLRTDLAFNVPESTVSVHVRVDVLDNLSLGSLPVGPPADTRQQRSPGSAFVIKRAWAQVLTPIGLIAAGRIGSHWGLGMLSNGGDCPSCDTDDAADRVFFATAFADHLWTLAFDFTSVGPNVPRSDGVRFLDLDPLDDTSTLTFAVMNVRDGTALRRRTRAERTTLEYGAFVSYRWQLFDWSPSYLPGPERYELSRTQLVGRGYQAVAGDAFVRLTGPWGYVGAEGAIIGGRFEEASLVPGVFLRDPVESLQWGLAVESTFVPVPNVLELGLDLGAASGDPAPGFGAFPGTRGPGRPGDRDGAQLGPPFDMRVDNFRFHPNYRVDRILFREIIGTVTDVFYLRPHARLTLVEHPTGRLRLGLAGVFTTALEASSTPGGDALLGFELDPTLSYENDEGWSFVAEYAVLVPFAGLNNPALGLDAQPAQLLRLQLWVTL